jgi:hypothetical protein
MSDHQRLASVVLGMSRSSAQMSGSVSVLTAHEKAAGSYAGGLVPSTSDYATTCATLRLPV